MSKQATKWLAFAGLVSLGAASLFGQDSKALIDALVKKGILSDADAKAIAAEVLASPSVTIAIAASMLGASTSSTRTPHPIV